MGSRNTSIQTILKENLALDPIEKDKNSKNRDT